jgi:type II secretion system protein I
MSNAAKGFTLIEVLVAIVLVAVGVTGTLGALSAMAQSKVRLQQSQLMQKLANDKLAEVIATGDAFNGAASGTFDSAGAENMTWSSEDASTGVENLDAITVTVKKDDREVSASTLYYRAPATTGTGSGATGTGQ